MVDLVAVKATGVEQEEEAAEETRRLGGLRLGVFLCFAQLRRLLDRSGGRSSEGRRRRCAACLLGFSGGSRAARRRLNIPEGGRVGKRRGGRRPGGPRDESAQQSGLGLFPDGLCGPNRPVML